MNFDLSDEQLLLQDTVDQFLSSECPPARLRELFDADDAFDPVLFKGMAELGLAGLHLPDEYGGAGLELLDLALAAEVLGRHAAPGPFFGHALAGLALALGGSKAQQERWLPRLAAGDAIGSVAFAEEGPGWQPNEWSLEERPGGRRPRGGGRRRRPRPRGVRRERLGPAARRRGSHAPAGPRRLRGGSERAPAGRRGGGAAAP
jgi:hypothetical protein